MNLAEYKIREEMLEKVKTRLQERMKGDEYEPGIRKAIVLTYEMLAENTTKFYATAHKDR